jgi:protein tyrosine phosphatase
VSDLNGFYRYSNILCPISTMVGLPPNGEVDFSSQFPANYVKSDHSLIACEGPRDVNSAQFWQMVWKESVTAISMLTNTVEGGRNKCAQYWPDDIEKPKQYGNVTVSLTKIEHFSDYVIRTFTLNQGDQKREVSQFHYTAWPDHGVPGKTVRDGAVSVVNFTREFRKALSSNQGTGLIHCSAGVGRTGTMVAIDRILNEREKGSDFENTEFDLDNAIVNIRSMRGPSCVQTKDQYLLASEALCLIASHDPSVE